MAQRIFENQTANVESDIYILEAPGMVQVDISGIADGADILTTFLDESDNKIIVVPLSSQFSIGYVLPPPPLGAGGYDYIQKRRLQFAVENAGGSTDINLSVSTDSGTLKEE